MEQKIPKIGDADIKRIIERDFPQWESSEIEKILQMYISKSKKGRNRIYASILKLSDGNLELIKKLVEKANIDFRDIISLAEYPNYSKQAMDEDIPVKKKKQLIKDDWFQYEYWLNKTH